jgi:hypothetical protein
MRFSNQPIRFKVSRKARYHRSATYISLFVEAAKAFAIDDWRLRLTLMRSSWVLGGIRLCLVGQGRVRLLLFVIASDAISWQSGAMFSLSLIEWRVFRAG